MAPFAPPQDKAPWGCSSTAEQQASPRWAITIAAQYGPRNNIKTIGFIGLRVISTDNSGSRLFKGAGGKARGASRSLRTASYLSANDTSRHTGQRSNWSRPKPDAILIGRRRGTPAVAAQATLIGARLQGQFTRRAHRQSATSCASWPRTSRDRVSRSDRCCWPSQLT